MQENLPEIQRRFGTLPHGIDGHLREPYRMTDLLNPAGRLLKGE
jgi:hypothetical protein